MLLGGCALYDGDAAKRAQLNSLIGHPESDVVRVLGVPTRTNDSDGRRFLAYDSRRLDILPGFGGGFGYGGFGFGRFGGGFGGFGGGFGPGFPPEVIERGCDTTFELGSGRVLSWTLRGSGCV
jgi:hypothetical protein